MKRTKKNVSLPWWVETTRDDEDVINHNTLRTYEELGNDVSLESLGTELPFVF